ncbi:MAG: hypothetical protein C3F02_02270 [Parcubacteria group bacterium]|nr:MAG: hypothetical protein C3F02_02270 [Parcubacteria group bacterium]
MNRLFILALLIIPALFAPRVTFADNADIYYGINDLVQQGVRLGSKDLRTTIAGIINVILGFLGVIAVVAVIYGGFQIMTSQGQADKNSSGRAAIIAGVIGLAIVLSAYAISSFVLGELYNGTR